MFREFSIRSKRDQFFQASTCTTSVQWNLIHSIKTMNWTKFQASPNLTREQIAILTTPGPNEHPHSALLPPNLACPHRA